MQQADIRPTVFSAGVHYSPSSISTRFEETARVSELQETCALNDIEIDENTQKTEMLAHLQRKREEFEALDPELQSAVYVKEAIRTVVKATRTSTEMRILDILEKMQTDMAKQTDIAKIQADIAKMRADVSEAKQSLRDLVRALQAGQQQEAAGEAPVDAPDAAPQ